MENTNPRKLKILYVITQGEWGGAQRYVFDIATKLSDNFKICVAVGEKDGKNDLQNKLQITNYKLQINDKIQIIKLRHLKRNISPFHDILAILELAKLYKTLQPDIIHLNSSKAGIIGSLATISYKLKAKSLVVYTAHGWVFNEPTRQLGRLLYRWLEKFTARWKDKIIVLSDSDYQDGLDSCFRSPRYSFGEAGRNDKVGKNKLVKIPIGIEPPNFLDKQTARQELQKLSPIAYRLSPIIVGTITNLYPSKGLDTLIEAVRIINNKYQITNSKYIIIGEGSERKKLENLIKKYDLKNIIHLTGSIENASQYLKAFDLFVLPSRKEGLPYTLLEAMAAELPIVATDVGGVKELIPDAITPDDPKILAEKIIQTIQNPTSTQQNTPSFEEMLKKTKTIYYSDYQAKPYL